MLIAHFKREMLFYSTFVTSLALLMFLSVRSMHLNANVDKDTQNKMQISLELENPMLSQYNE